MVRLHALVAAASIVVVGGLWAGVRAVAQAVPDADGPISIPLPVEITATRIYVRARLNDREAWFELDTAARDVYVDDEFAVAAGVDLDAGRLVEDTGVTYRMRNGTAELRVGPLSATPVAVRAILLHRFADGRFVAGLIGLGPFKDSELLVDLGARSIQVCSQARCVARCENTVALVLQDGKPRIPVSIGPRFIMGFIDTGFARDLLVYPSLARDLALREAGEVRYGPGIGGRTGTVRTARAPSLTIGAQHFDGLTADLTADQAAFGVSSRDIDLVIGIGALRRLGTFVFAPREYSFRYGSCSLTRRDVHPVRRNSSSAAKA
jgi:hypothetical protein